MASVHGSAVDLAGRGLLIIGPPGAGKSALALALMGFGCQLVCDDRAVLTARNGRLIATAPVGQGGLIEARGLGLLHADGPGRTELVAVVNLAELETQRLPPGREIMLEGVGLPVFHKVESAHFAPALLQYLRAGRCETA